VDRVRKQRHGAAEEHDDELENGRAQQDEETGFYGPDTVLAGLERVIYGIGRIMGVRNKQPIEETLDSSRVLMGMPVVMVVM
jgi:hypothetical protein